MAYDIFISYSDEDMKIANDICRFLEGNNYKCWIKYRDIHSDDIVNETRDAIVNSQIMLNIFSKNSKENRYVLEEVGHAFSFNKPIVVLNIDGSYLDNEFAYFLKNQSWCHGSPPDVYDVLIGSISQLITTVSFEEDGLSAGVTKQADQASNSEIYEINVPTIFLSYDENDLSDIKIDLESFQNQLSSNIAESDLCIAFLSSNSIKSCEEDIKKAFSQDIPIILVYLEDVNLKFGLSTKMKYRSKINKLKDSSIKKSDMDDGHYIKFFEEFGIYILEKEEKSSSIHDSNKFQYLNSLIKESNTGDEIIIDSNILLHDDEFDLFKNGIKIEGDNITINGNGHTIDGNGNARIFEINGQDIVFKNISFLNGHNDRGGVIFSVDGSNLSFINCEFNNNGADDGGAIFHDGGILKVSDCKFHRNNSKSMGGAVHIENGTLEIMGTEFNNSYAPFGGAIRANKCQLNIENSSFMNNSSQLGGAINYNECEIRISDSCFSKNSAQTNGGAIETQNGSLNIQGSEFSNNSAKYGSAIRNHAETTIKDCRFSQNTSIEGVIYNKKGSLDAMGCQFSQNESDNYILYNEDYLKINASVFQLNNAPNIILNLLNSSLSSCEFLRNTSQFILKNQGNSNIIGCLFEENDCDMNILNESDLTVEKLKLMGDYTFIQNNKNLYVKDLNDDIKEKVENLGDVHYLIRREDGFDFTYLDELIHGSNSNEISLSHDVSFENYERDFYEGGIDLDIDGLVLDGNNHTIDGCNLSRIFNVSSKNITLKNIIFKNGHSHKDDYLNPLNNNGGAIRNNSKSILKLINCEFLDNNSEDKGGAIDNRGGNLEIIDCKFTSNFAEFIGGAIINRKNAITTLINTEMKNNTTKHYGGAIENEGESHISNCNLIENGSKYGGAIRNRDKLVVSDSIFRNNDAGDGGAINNFKNGQVELRNSLFESNVADSGGAIENRGIRLVVDHCKLYENSSNADGGAIYSYFSDEFLVKNCIFNNNRCQGDGGAIWNFSSKSNLELIDSKFDENHPDNIFQR